jgi:hypothetical protein
VIFCRHEVPLASIHSEQIRDHLPGYGQRRSIGIAFLLPAPILDAIADRGLIVDAQS